MGKDHRSLPALALVVAAAGCTGTILEPRGGPGEEEPAVCDGEPRPGPHPRIVRLTHLQYDNAVRDLLGLDVRPSLEFLADPVFAGFDNNAEALVVSERQARDYRRTAEALAQQATTPDHLARLLPCAPDGGEACARQMIETFGLRAYRRPLSPAEVDAYLALFRGAGAFYGEGTEFEKGIRVVVESMLQSPNFLYRVERSAAVDDQGLIPLDGYELASRLSFTLWNTIPDDELLAAAASGALLEPAGIEAQARRMLEDERARHAIDDFHRQWLHMARYEGLSKDPELYPAFGSQTEAWMQQETREYLRHVILEENGDFRTLMTAPYTFVNAGLAATYGIPGDFPQDELTKVAVDASQRAGFLTQLGFLASHAYFDFTSPIHRGVFVQRQILCATLPDPPGDVDLNLPPISEELRTTRQRVEAHTSPPQCSPCHSIINPAGFAFEHFDAIGAWRDQENGEPIDASGTIVADGREISFDGAVDLIHQLGDSPQARRCYVQQWFRYAHARRETNADACTIDDLDRRMTEGGLSIKELLVAMTQTRTFRFRAQEVQP